MTQDQNTQARTYAAAHFGLELDGLPNVGLFRSIEGGSIKTDVMTYQHGANYDRWRQLGKPKFEDIKLQVGMSMTKPFFMWVTEFFDGKGTRKNGAIIAADFYYKARARREFKEALIKELVFPKLEGTDQNAAYMTLGMTVEDLVFKKGDGKQFDPPGSGFNTQKVWTACNFRFRLDGFDDACKRVSKIDSFTIKQNILEYHTGSQRAPIKCPSQIDFPQLSIYVPETDAQPFLDHFAKRGVKGEVPGRMTGMIQTFDNDKRDLFTLSFSGADVINVQPDKLDATADTIHTMKVDIYTEKMAFKYLAMDVE